MSMQLPTPISDRLRSAMWAVDSYAAKIMRQDDKAKVRRLIREYQKATDRLLSVALDDRYARLTAQPAPEQPGCSETGQETDAQQPASREG